MDLRREIIKIIEEGYGLYLADDCGFSLDACFDDAIENKNKIASSINDAINEMICCGDKGLHSFRNAISYSSYVAVERILYALKAKSFISQPLLEQLKENLEEAYKMYKEDL